jgi:hypothetical protein
MIDIRLIFRRVRTKGLSSGWCECWCWSRNRAGGGNGGVSDGRAGVVAGVVVGLEVVVLLKWGLEIVLLLESELVQSGVWHSGWSEDWCSCSSCDCLSGAG